MSVRDADGRVERPTVTAVVCAFADDRWTRLLAAIDSLREQTQPPDEIVVVIDHNPDLLARLRHVMPDVLTVPSDQRRGLSGARNTAVARATSDIVAFLDDDATAAKDWVARIVAAFTGPDVAGVGGAIVPVWATGRRPRWFPREFDWVVGCSYTGLPDRAATVRNLIGCNMAFRRDVFTAIGGFRDGMGRIGSAPLGCEETELCIRARQRLPAAVFRYDPRIAVAHHVAADRATWRYFVRRCHAEGRSKSQIVDAVGRDQGLASERRYVLRVLPLGVLRALGDAAAGRHAGALARAAAIVAGLVATALGYAHARRDRARPVRGALATTPPGGSGVAFRPVRVVRVELTGAIPAISALDGAGGRRYDSARVLVTLAGQPVGAALLPLGGDGLTAAQTAARIWSELAGPIARESRRQGRTNSADLPPGGLPSPPAATSTPATSSAAAPAAERVLPPVSVVIATRDRTAALRRCLDSLFAVTYPDFDVIVVDNAPSSTATADLIREEYADRPITYLREDTPGLAMAHNRGLDEVRRPLVAFTDDDVVVDPQWLEALVAGFRRSTNVGCVTGMIVPLELETRAQALTEAHGRFDKGCVAQVFTYPSASDGPLFPYAAGAFGSGANMAFRSDVLRHLGGFDPALGAGSHGVGGDDLAAFVAVLTAGFALAYEPAAIVHHAHDRDAGRLRLQARNYGVGLTAYLTSVVTRRPAVLADFARRLPRAVIHLVRMRLSTRADDGERYPRGLVALELAGAAWGPIAYARGRRDARRAATVAR